MRTWWCIRICRKSLAGNSLSILRLKWFFIPGLLLNRAGCGSSLEPTVMPPSSVFSARRLICSLMRGRWGHSGLMLCATTHFLTGLVWTHIWTTCDCFLLIFWVSLQLYFDYSVCLLSLFSTPASGRSRDKTGIWTQQSVDMFVSTLSAPCILIMLLEE